MHPIHSINSESVQVYLQTTYDVDLQCEPETPIYPKLHKLDISNREFQARPYPRWLQGA